MLKRPIQTLPLRTTPFSVMAIKVVQMTPTLIARWHSFVQPIIDSRYSHSGLNVPEASIRADVGWDWKRIYLFALTHSFAAKVRTSQSGPAKTICIVTEDSTGLQLPIGMLTAVPIYFTNLSGDQRSRSFAWFLADAPGEFYVQHLGIPPVSGMATALLDTAIQLGLDIGQDGTFLLHADPNGGQKLINFYRNHCKMQQLAPNCPPVTASRRHPSEEYFFMSAVEAAAFCSKYDARR